MISSKGSIKAFKSKMVVKVRKVEFDTMTNKKMLYILIACKCELIVYLDSNNTSKSFTNKDLYKLIPK